MARAITEFPDEQLVAEWRRRYPISIIAHQSTDPKAIATYIATGEDVSGTRILAQATNTMVEALYQRDVVQAQEEVIAEMEFDLAEAKEQMDDDDDDTEEWKNGQH